jgi:hypothetical protein
MDWARFQARFRKEAAKTRVISAMKILLGEQPSQALEQAICGSNEDQGPQNNLERSLAWKFPTRANSVSADFEASWVPQNKRIARLCNQAPLKRATDPGARKCDPPRER